jgi:hypothetical protein
MHEKKTKTSGNFGKENKSWRVIGSKRAWRTHAWNENKTKSTSVVAWRRKKQKMNDACCALYITALVAGVLELETNVLHVPDPTMRCICTAIMVAIPLFPFLLLQYENHDRIMLHNNIGYIHHGIYTISWTSLSIDVFVTWSGNWSSVDQWASIEVY